MTQRISSVASHDISEMLRNLRSVKLRPKERARVDLLRRHFEGTGSIPYEAERWLHEVCRRYAKQLCELQEARARAIRTNALRSVGLSRAEAHSRAQARDRTEQAAAEDLGF